MKSERIVLVGAGNLATSLAPALKNIGVPPVAVWSRTLKSASSLAENIGCEYSCDINSLPEADIVIISVVDSALSDVARKIALRYPHALVLHTAGSVSIEDVLNPAPKYQEPSEEEILNAVSVIGTETMSFTKLREAVREKAHIGAPKAKEYEKIYPACMDLLNQMYELIGADEMDAAEFLSVFEAGVAEIRVGTIPQNVDQVVICAPYGRKAL